MLVCKINDDDYDSVIDPTIDAGALTHFVSNSHPEMHEFGWTRYQSNVETFKNYISTVRNDIDASERYIPMEDAFIQIGKGSDKDPVFKIEGMDKVLLDNFMEARNGAMLIQRGDVIDKTGKPKIFDREGRP